MILKTRNFLCKPPIEVRSKSKNPYPKLSNDMWHVVWMQVNQINSWLLVVGSQIINLISNPSFGHKLCYKYPNGSCKPIFDIYVSKYFQWYKELFNIMIFYALNCFLKIQESIRTPTPKVKTHLKMWRFIPHILLHSGEHEMCLLGFTLSLHLCKPLVWSWTQG